MWSGCGTDNTVQAVFIQTQGENDLFDGSNTLVSTNRQWVTLEQQGSPGISITIGFDRAIHEPGTATPSHAGRQLTCEIYERRDGRVDQLHGAVSARRQRTA